MLDLTPGLIAVLVLNAAGLFLLVQFVVGVLGERGRRSQAALAGATAAPAGATIRPLAGLPPFAQRLIVPPLADLGRLLFGPLTRAAAVEERLRRAGWPYASLADYFGSKVVYAVVAGAAGALLPAVFALSPLVIVLGALGLGALGVHTPDRDIEEALKKRRATLFREMAWTVDRLAAVLATGQNLQPAIAHVVTDRYGWVAAGAGGLFIAFLRDIVHNLQSGRNDVSELLGELRQGLPDALPQLDEFVAIVEMNLRSNVPATDQLRALGREMRNELNNQIEQIAQDAELRVSIIMSTVVAPAVLVIAVGTALIRLLTLNLFQ